MATRKRKHSDVTDPTVALSPAKRLSSTIASIVRSLVGSGSAGSELREDVHLNAIVEDVDTLGNAARIEEHVTSEEHTAGSASDPAESEARMDAPTAKRRRTEDSTVEAPARRPHGKSSAPRNYDPYDVVVDQAEEPPAAVLPKRNQPAKKAAIAKPPLMLPRRTRATTRRDLQDAPAAAPARKSSRTGGNAQSSPDQVASGDESNKAKALGAKRGQKPKKTSNPQPRNSGSRSRDNEVDVQPEEREPSVPQENVIESADAEGVSDILENPSPVKPVGQVAARKRSQGNRATGGGAQSAVPHRNEQPRSSNAGAEQGERQLSELPEGSVFAQDEEREVPTIFKMKELDRMFKTAKLVGKSKSRDERAYHVVFSPKEPKSELGISLHKEIQALKTLFEEVDIEQQEEITKSVDSSTPILSDISRLMSQANTEKLSKELQSRSSSALLRDYFFFVIPGFLEAIWEAANLYGMRQDTPIDQVKLLWRLANILLYLCQDALEHNARPPKPGYENPVRKYSYAQPSRRNLPSIRALINALKNELYRRRHIEAVENDLRKQAERELRHQQVLNEERLRARRETQESRKKQIRDVLRKFNSPITGILALAELEQALERERAASVAGTGQRQRVTVRRVGTSNAREILRGSTFEPQQFRRFELDTEEVVSDDAEESDEEAADADDEPEIERIKMFERTKQARSQVPRPWSNREMQLFVEIMQEHYGMFLPSFLASTSTRLTTIFRKSRQVRAGCEDIGQT